jgi:hypothetical protein
MAPPLGDHQMLASHAVRQTLAVVVDFYERALAFKAITGGPFVGHFGSLFIYDVAAKSAFGCRTGRLALVNRKPASSSARRILRRLPLKPPANSPCLTVPKALLFFSRIATPTPYSVHLKIGTDGLQAQWDPYD